MTKFGRLAIVSLMMAMVSPALSRAEDFVVAGAISLQSPWIPVSPPAAEVLAGYLSIANDGERDDRLLSATTPAANRIEIHEMAMHDGVMRMRPLADGLVIPAGGSIDLKPGGLHLMFVGMQGVAEGAHVPVTLQFERAGDIEVEFLVRPRK